MESHSHWPFLSDNPFATACDRVLSNAAQWFIVSKVTFTTDELEQFEVCQVKVEKATGHVCPRCWNYTESENEDGLCDRCNHVLHD